MSEPAVFVLIRDGQKRYFADRWANAFLFREILWGPDELERWLTDDQEIDDWTDEACGGVVVDYDNRSWSGPVMRGCWRFLESNSPMTSCCKHLGLDSISNSLSAA
jgi:hypothetical protein